MGAMLIALTFIILLLVYLLTSPIPQWNSYHQFADTRKIWGIPNFWNVFSNIPFFLVSILGLLSLVQQWPKNNLSGKEAIVFLILFLGIFLTGIGSSYYHWAPDNTRLVWDRIPITIVFMSLLSLTIMERINLTWGFLLLFPLIFMGVGSVLYWNWTELSGHGDVRLYGLVQFYTMFLMVIILFLFPKSYPPLNAYLGMFGFYILAKFFEYFDWEMYRWTGYAGGHMLKHVFAAISAYFIVIILKALSTKVMNTSNEAY